MQLVPLLHYFPFVAKDAGKLGTLITNYILIVLLTALCLEQSRELFFIYISGDLIGLNPFRDNGPLIHPY
jgi:hypothetical protein